MILNESQYEITQAQLKKFQTSVQKLAASEGTNADLNNQLRHQAHLDSMNSQIESLQQELQEYHNLKEGQKA